MDAPFKNRYQEIYDDLKASHLQWMRRRNEQGDIPSDYLRHIGRMASEVVLDEMNLRPKSVMGHM